MKLRELLNTLNFREIYEDKVHFTCDSDGTLACWVSDEWPEEFLDLDKGDWFSSNSDIVCCVDGYTLDTVPTDWETAIVTLTCEEMRRISEKNYE